MEKRKVLLVDDDIDLLEQSKISFESKGYNVVTAENVDLAGEGRRLAVVSKGKA